MSSSPSLQAPPRAFHFMGICGTAMGAVAAMLRDQGYTVTGSDDNVYPPMSTFLADKGIAIQAGYRPENLPADDAIIVVGNTIKRGNPELEAALDQKRFYLSLPETMKTYFLRKTHNMVVTGTHGKTTTTSLLTWIFEHNGLNPSYLIGGIPNNFSQGARFTDSEWFIIEGDEYDTAFFDKRSKFIHYQPEAAIINNLEFDHADIFENLAAVQKTFSHFIRIVPRNGVLIANGDDPNLAPLLNVDFCPVKRFGLGAHNSVQAFNLNLAPTASEFEIPSFKFRLNLVGEFNVRNALAVAACAKHFGLSNKQIQSAFDTFRGVKRRMEVRGVAGGVTIIDDFGHHPTAIRLTLEALRVKFPREKIWAVFEPRSNTTRRNVFQNELPPSFNLADHIVISQVARLEQLAVGERLNPEKLMQDLKTSGKSAEYLPDADAIVAHIAKNARGGDVVVVFSNGGFGGIHGKLLERLARR